MHLAHNSSHSALFKRGGRLLRLLVDDTGANAIEFALAAVPLFMFILGVIDFSRLYWTHSELQYAAEATARCATVNCCASNPGSCGGGSGNTGLQTYAAQQLLGITATSSDLSNFSVTNQACGNQVSFSYTYNFIVGPIIPNSALTLTASACNQA